MDEANVECAPVERGDLLPQAAIDVERDNLTFRPMFVFALSIFLGLMAGLAELGLVLVGRTFHVRLLVDSILDGRHFFWMIPVSLLLLFGTIGLLLAIVTALMPRIAPVFSVYLLVFLMFFCPLLAISQIYGIACAILAAGLASRLAPWILRGGRSMARVVRIGAPVGVGLIVLLVGLAFGRPVLEEARAKNRLRPPPSHAPNVLLIVLDTVRADHLTPYGYDRDTTPNLAKLAREGILFEWARSTASWTLPAHASLFTGRWPHELSAGPSSPLDASYPTLAEFFRSHGYDTAGFVANTFFCNSDTGLSRGFVHYEDFVLAPLEILRSSGIGRRVVRRIVRDADFARMTRPRAYFFRKDAARINRDFLDWQSQQGDRPFFVFLNYYDAHDPYIPDRKFEGHFGLKPSSRTDLSMLRDWYLLDKASLTPREVALACDGYDDCLYALDHYLGQLFEELKRRGLFEKTITIITSDHGEHLGEHGLFSHGISLYRPELDVPLLIIDPYHDSKGQRVSEPVSLRDIPATLADLAGFDASSPFPGRSLRRFSDVPPGPGHARAEPMLSEIDAQVEASANQGRAPAHRGALKAILAEGMVYIRNGDGEEELYDITIDPTEQNNLATSKRAQPTLSRFRGLLDRLLLSPTPPRGATVRAHPSLRSAGAG